jgi:hypothetical protein
MVNQIRNVWIIALGLAGVLVYQAHEMGGQIAQKADSQNIINERLKIHINTYEALKAETAGWDNGLMDVDNIGDLLGLYNMVNIEQYAGMQTNLNTFQLASSNVHTVNGNNIGIVKVCIGSGGRHLDVANSDYETLISGFDEMAKANAVSFSGITIEGGSDVAQAQISDVCLLMRSGVDQEGV